MRDGWRGLVLAFLKVPPEPHAPIGSPGSIRVFRAGRNYLRYKVSLWGIRQVGALIGALLFIQFADAQIDGIVAKARAKSETKIASLAPDDPKRQRIERAFRYTDTGKTLFHWLEIAGIGFLVIQAPFTFALVRLDYEMRWYIATDRSLRLREGLASIREMTLTYANVQNVSIRQGPLQRVLGLADLVVQTAGGGGGGDEHDHDAGPSMHEGVLRGVDNAEEIRDLILTHLRRLRDAGIGDPDDRHDPRSVVHATDAIAAAREALEAARELRRAVTRA